MKKTLIIIIFFLFFMVQVSVQADEKNKCPDEESLTLKARIALVSAQEYMGENKNSEAKDILSQFIQKYPDQNHAYITFTLANLLLAENLLTKALGFYQKTIDMCPLYAPAWQNMGKTYFDLQKFNQAAFAMEKVFELTGRQEYQLLFHAAVAHFSDKNPGKALAHMQFLTSGRAGIPKPNWVKFMVNLSIEQNQAPKAIQVIENLLGQKNPDPYLFKLAATLYLYMNKYRDAAQVLSVYSLLTPLSIAEQTLLADLYRNLGVPFKAAGLYEKIIKQKPERKIYKRLASAWFEAYKPEKAMAVIHEGLKTYPDLHALWKLKGWIYYKNDIFGQASEAFAKASTLKKSDLQSLFMHGLCASKAGQYDIAKKALKKAASHAQYKQQALGIAPASGTEC